MSGYDFDLFVIGGGSGGVRAARVAASQGHKVGLAEEDRYGGTCVIRGCVPKKLFVYASQFSEHFKDSSGFGWSVRSPSFDWPTLIANKDKEIARLEALYQQGLQSAGVTMFSERASLVDDHRVKLESQDRIVSAEHILIAVGGTPWVDSSLAGHELCITSDQAFHLPTFPDHVVVAGGGYIAVEFVNIFHGLGAKVTLVYRGEQILRGFDNDVRNLLADTMRHKGIDVVCNTTISQVQSGDDCKKHVTLSDGRQIDADQVMLAIGRRPKTDGLGLEQAGVETQKGAIIVDEFSRTSLQSVWAIGDVTNRVQLTPVAIHEAMCLIETIFNENPTQPDHEMIATAVFSQPEIGTAGLSEADAVAIYGDIDVYAANFKPMRNTLSGSDERMLLKLVVDHQSNVVVGAHILGHDAGEMAQLLGIVLKAQLTKADFDRTMAVHPTAAEELVTMYAPSYQIRDGKRV